MLDFKKLLKIQIMWVIKVFTFGKKYVYKKTSLFP